MSTRFQRCRRVLIGLACFAVIAVPSGAADVLVFTEADLDGHSRTVSEGGVVDINSTLEVRVDVPEIYRRAGAREDSAQALMRMLDRLEGLQNAVTAGAANLEALRVELAGWTAGTKDTAQWKRMRRMLQRVANPAKLILSDPFLAAKLDPLLDQADRMSIAQQYAMVFATLDNQIDSLRIRRDEYFSRNGFSVRAGAWLRGETADVPVHLEGFDRYPEREEVIVARWRIALNEQEREQLKKNVEVASALNQGQLGRLLSDGLAASIGQMVEIAEPCAKSIQETLESFEGQLGETVEPVRNQLKDALTKVGRLRSWCVQVRLKYASGTGGSNAGAEALLIGTNDDLVALTSQVEDASTAIQQLKRVAEKTATSSALRQTLKPILDWKPDACSTSFSNIQSTARDLADQCLIALGLRRRNNALLAFGEEVLALDLASVPSESAVRLPRMGPRKAGDIVEIRIAVARPNSAARDLQRTRITMRRVLPHIDIAVGLAFALADTSHRPRNVFQSAPSYSLLIKGWPFRSHRKSNLFDIGFGLNLASLDFNHDDAQELGVGFAVGGLLENLLQAGYGYNVTAGTPYFFFGIRLPFPNMTLAKTQVDNSSE